MRLRGCDVAVGAVLLAALAACGGSSGAADPSSPMPITRTVGTTSVPAGATPTPAVDPNSDAAVIAGVRAWASALTAATSAASVAPLMSAATARCSCIQGEERAITYLVANDLHLTAKYSVTSAQVLNRTADSALVSATVSSPAYAALRQDGSLFKSEAGDSSSSKYSMKLVGSKWLVDTVV